MANSRKRVKRKSNVIQSNQQQVGTSRKRNTSEKISHLEKNNQNKRRRSNRYNLRDTNSVELVSETPCFQSTEQREKYTRLGLNSALFIKGSQCPKRKQSHISIITISSDDEDTAEQRTTEWVNNLNQNYQSGIEPVKEKPFDPLCTSTPNTSQAIVQCQPCSTETLVLDETDRNHCSPSKQKEGQDDTFQLTISVPESLADSKYVMEYQQAELDKTNIYGKITSSNVQRDDQSLSESSSYVMEFQQDELDKDNKSGNITSSAVQEDDQGMSDGSDCINKFHQDDLSLDQKRSGSVTSNLWSMEKEINLDNNDTGNKRESHQCPEPSLNLASDFGLALTFNFINNSGSKETWPPNQFYFGPSSETKNLVSTQEFPVLSNFTVHSNPTDKSASDESKFPPKTLNGGQEETNGFQTLRDNSQKNTNNEKDSVSINSDGTDEVVEGNTFYKGT